MFKKTFIVIMALVLAVSMTGLGFAAPSTGNTSNKGSLLIFPKIVVGDHTTTIIQISNDYTTRPGDIDLKCFWFDGIDKRVRDFQIEMSKSQPIYIDAKTGRGTINVPSFPGTEGDLTCFAVEANQSTQIKWNHLSGNAMVVDYKKETAYQYNSWNFPVGPGIPQGASVDPQGRLELSADPSQYYACPRYLEAKFPAVRSGYYPNKNKPFLKFYDTDLAVSLCKKDLKQDRAEICTKLTFTIWNEDETKFTGTHQCVDCWIERYLSEIDTFPENFYRGQLKTRFARFRVQGIYSNVCDGYNEGACYDLGGGVTNIVDTGIVGVTVQKILFPRVCKDGDEKCQKYGIAEAATTPNHAGIDPTGYIEWDDVDGIPDPERP
jgi:hypothetical protein